MSDPVNPNVQEVSISADSVVVKMASTTERKLQPADFSSASDPRVILEPAEVAFYVAMNEDGKIERSVMASAADRQVVAALVGNWIAEGFDVKRISAKEYIKHLRVMVASASAKIEPQGGDAQGSDAAASGAPATPPAVPAANDSSAGEAGAAA